MADEQAEEFDEEGEGEGGKSRKKLYIIIGAVVLLLILAAVPFLMMGGDEEGEEEENTEDEVVEEDTGPKIPQYYAIPAKKEPGMTITMEPGSKFRQAQMSFRIFTYSSELVEYLKKNDPMIRHHILNTLSTADTANFLDKAGRENLQQDLKQALVDVLGKSSNEEDQKLADKLENVYFHTFILQ